jgi:glycosyltransferase involved in cell wall biosynthesis
MQAGERHSPAVSSTLSVVLCTYNGEKYLGPQIESIIKQSFPFTELIISDDGSSDGTLEIINQYAKKDSRIKLLAHGGHLGPNRNFEKALSAANSEYLAPSDQDDEWHPQKLELMMKSWKSECRIMFSLPGQMNDLANIKKQASRANYHDIENAHSLVFNTPVNGHALLLKRDLLSLCTPFPKDIFWDWWLTMHAVSHGVIGCVNTTLTWQRIHEENHSRNIHGIKNKPERDTARRKQWTYFIRSFYERQAGKPSERDSLLEYTALLDKMDGKHFSPGMFLYIMRHRHEVFHYKTKGLSYFSHLKHAIRLARSGVL